MEDNNLFYMIMEADDDIPAFDESGMEEMPSDPSPMTDTASDDGPPPMGDESADDFGSFDDMGDGSDENGDMGDEADEDNKNGEGLTAKTNNILNQTLYQKMLDRNNQIDKIIEQIQLVIPALPYEVVQSIDKPLGQLKSALNKGQSYVIDRFIDCEYGENLLFYQKLNALYVLLEDSINTILKKVK